VMCVLGNMALKVRVGGLVFLSFLNSVSYPLVCIWYYIVAGTR